MSLCFAIQQTHGLPCPPVLDTWRNKVEQRAVDMICYIYNPSKRFENHKFFFIFYYSLTLMLVLYLWQGELAAVCGSPPELIITQH